MQAKRLTLTIVSLAAMVTLAFHYPALAQSGDSSDESALSPYWSYAVSRWEPIILQEAQRRSLDPDLIAALIWKESRGLPATSGPAGAVGLMMVMPFSWRPSPEELENPWTNVFWGARVLATVIRDGRGDLYYALAAYNGSWKQIHLRVTRRYAASVLDSYARAIAVRHGLPEDGDWLALFAVEGAPGPKTLVVLGPQRPLARYTERPWGQADIPMLPSDVPPHATAITFADEQGVERRVNVWLIAEDSPSTIPYAVQSIFFPPSASYGRNERHTVSASHLPTTPIAPPVQSPVPTDTPTPPPAAVAVVLTGGAGLRPGADAQWDPHLALPAGTELQLSGYDPNFPDWVYASTTDGTSNGWVQIAELEINYELSGLPRVTPIPTLTPTPAPTLTPTPHATATTTPTQTLPADCQNGPLWLEAWYLDRTYEADGWTATIFAEGHGGDCVYTYAWEGETQGGPTSGPVTFEVSHADRFAVIMGTVSVTSAGETVEVGLFIKPPGDD